MKKSRTPSKKQLLKPQLPLLPTTVIGSYSFPKWLEEVRRLGEQGKMSPEAVDEAHDNAVKSVIKDQEMAGVDIITDGEVRRETMVYFFSKRIHGFDFEHAKMHPIGDLDPGIQMPDPVIVDKVRWKQSLHMDRHFRFLREHTVALPKVCVTGPQMLAKRATNEFYKNDRELIFDLADILNVELKGLVKAGCTFIQIDEPVWVGYPNDMPWLVEAFGRLVSGVKAKIAVHVCYGNYQLKKLFKGKYADLFPALLDVDAGQIALEFAVSDGVGLELFKKYKTDKEIAVGVIDVKDEHVETPDVVARRIRKALKFIPAERMYIVPDCGMKFMPRHRAYGKLKAMVEGTRIVRKEIGVS
ncbi:MAG: methionine synthase [Ignavibacteriales bacterium]|nr:methionine synthase [Ignavibacteriales bacterium]